MPICGLNGRNGGLSRLALVMLLVFMLSSCGSAAPMTSLEGTLETGSFAASTDPSEADSSAEPEPSEISGQESSEPSEQSVPESSEDEPSEEESLPESSAESSETVSEPILSSEPSEEEASEVSESSEPEPSSPSEEPLDTSSADTPVSSAESAEEKEIRTVPLWSPESGYVGEGGSVDDSYFSDALFIGNSRMQGFVLYSGLKNVHAYADVGLMVDTVFTKECISLGGNKVTVADALTATAAGYSKFYLMFGLNELGWSSTSTFVKKYSALIDCILAANPDAKIYVQSIIPMTAEKSAQSDWLCNENVNAFNKLIWQMAADKGVYYLHVAGGLAGADGALPEDSSSDGVHLNKTACSKWLQYLKNHTA